MTPKEIRNLRFQHEAGWCAECSLAERCLVLPLADELTEQFRALAAADALADAASKPCYCFDGQLDEPYDHHGVHLGGPELCPVLVALNAYRALRKGAQ